MIDVGLDIAALVSRLEHERIVAPVIACGVANDARAAVSAIQAGAKEYVPLPPDPELIAAIISAVSRDQSQLVGSDPAIQKTLSLAKRVAGSDASVLITGESGTGKEVLARYVHQHSNRADKPFISINCAAIPDNLLESELFGHEKGAFTGAVARRIGKFEEANGGTLLLDEISEMDVRLQAKLLRALQERVIDRVGGTQPVPVNIRILATTNRDLMTAVQEGLFREDLLFRLNVVTLQIPALRERPSDIMELAHYFIGKYSDANGVSPLPISADAQRTLMQYHWTGNVRELENTMHRAVLLATGSEIDIEALNLTDGPVQSRPELLDTGPAAQAALTAERMKRTMVGRTVSAVEQELILDTLDHCLGNRTHAANILGISIRTLRNKLNQYVADGLDVAQPGETRMAS
jgi:DNA-binding NtrC family response regulator